MLVMPFCGMSFGSHNAVGMYIVCVAVRCRGVEGSSLDPRACLSSGIGVVQEASK